MYSINFRIILKTFGYLLLFCPSCDVVCPSPITFYTKSWTLCLSLRKCRIIQTLSFRPQCLVECNLVFLRGIHEIWWDGIWSRASVKSKTQLLTQPSRSWCAQNYKGANQSEGSSTVTIQSDSPSNAYSASQSFVAKSRGSSHNAKALGCGSWPWHATTSRCTDEIAQTTHALKFKTLG
jgi:hypothetical protein